MSAASILAINARYRDRAAEECAAGRGKAHLLGFAHEIGADFASTVFLKMTAELERATDETSEQVLLWADQFPQFAVNQLAEGIRDGWTLWGGGPGDDLDSVEAAACESFGERLNLLFATAQLGGEA